MMEVEKLTIERARGLLDGGEISAEKLAESVLSVIDQKDKEIGAFLEVYDNVLDQAKDADKRISENKSGALTGIPIALKDNILVEGQIASAASTMLGNYVAAYDATATTKLKEAGAVLLGRTNMDDAAMGSSTESSAYQVTKNPHDLTRVPGGSSGGSAAAVAAGMALGAFGSDTAGSVRLPASLCGVVGFKPTYGSVSRHGLIALGSSLDVIGPIANTVVDVEILFDATKGKDVMDSTTVDENDYEISEDSVKKIGVPTKLLDSMSRLDERVRANFDESIEKLKSEGFEVVDIELPHFMYGLPAYYIVIPAEVSANLARYDGVKYGFYEEGEDLLGDYMATRHTGFGPEPRRRIVIGTYVLSAGYHDAYYNRANAVRREIKKDYREAFNKVDVIATPTQVDPAFKLGEKIDDPVQMYLQDVFTVVADLTGDPAITVPSGFVEEEGKQLPLGLQFVAPHMHENSLFKIGKKFEEING